METNKILTASFLDLLFDNRNKDYGAYELRKTYEQRISRSLVITIAVTGLIYAGTALANSRSADHERYTIRPDVTIESIPDPKPPEKIPETPKPEPPVRTIAVTPPVIVDDNEVKHSMPTKEDADSSMIGLTTNEGTRDTGLSQPTEINDGTGVVENKKPENTEPFYVVQVEAKYAGNWENFLRRNLRAEVPADNGAPAGRYTIVIQFIVDVDGTVSNITPLTNLGYGMEQEAVRVLKKADKWEPAFQNGIHVKAYRRQPITFEVLTGD